jgi:hypothetical protein
MNQKSNLTDWVLNLIENFRKENSFQILNILESNEM